MCHVASSSNDLTINVWNTDTGELIQKYTGHTNKVFGLDQIDNDTIVSGSWDGTIQIWLISTGQNIKKIIVESLVISIKLILNGNQIACGLAGSTDNLRIYDMNTTNLVQVLNNHSSDVNSIEKLNEQYIASGSNDFRVVIWDLNTYTIKFILTAHTSGVYCLKLISSNLMASGDADGIIIIWDWLKGELIYTLNGHSNSLYLSSLDLFNDQILISGSRDSSIKIWSISNGQLLQTITTDIQIDALAVIERGKNNFRLKL